MQREGNRLNVSDVACIDHPIAAYFPFLGTKESRSKRRAIGASIFRLPSLVPSMLSDRLVNLGGPRNLEACSTSPITNPSVF